MRTLAATSRRKVEAASKSRMADPANPNRSPIPGDDPAARLFQVSSAFPFEYHGWKKRGWLTADKKPVKNDDLWRRLDTARLRHEVDWRWIKGHAGHEHNERADELARLGLKESLSTKS